MCEDVYIREPIHGRDFQMGSNGAEAMQTEPSQQAPVNLSPDIVQGKGNLQPGNNAENDDIYRCLDELSEFSVISQEKLGPTVIFTRSEYWSRGIQEWIKSGNVDPDSVVCEDDEGRGLLDLEINRWNLSDEQGHGEESPVLNIWNYQKELAENALLGRNTIICAPTGSGKTIVAVNIILNHLQEQPANGDQTRKVIFFARTVPLVYQQFQVLRKYLPKKCKIISLTGENKNSMHLDLIIPEYDVLVMTPRILENHFIRNPQDNVDMFSMMVFDECHHTHGKEPYNSLMLYYLKRKQLIKQGKPMDNKSSVKLPQIVGLTASIGVGDASDDSKAKDYMLQICGNLDVVRISTVVKNIDELNEKIHACEEELLPLQDREMDMAVRSILEKMKVLEAKIANISKKLKVPEFDTFLKDIPKEAKSVQYGQWVVKIQKFAKSLPRTESSEKNEWKRSLIVLADYLSTYNVALELHDLVLLRHVMDYLKKCFRQYSENKDCTQDEQSYFESFSDLQEQLKDKLDTENPNLELLKKCLMKYLVLKGAGSRGIIFVRTRALAIALALWLNSCGDKWIEGLKAASLTGSSVPVSKGGMTVPQQSATIEDFRTGKLRVLVATSVMEEGINIPDCNLVVKYNHSGNDISYIQAKGRIRKDGICVILATSKIIEKEILNKKKSQMMERVLEQLRQMDPAKILAHIEAHQQKIITEEEGQVTAKQIMKRSLNRQHFKMVCLRCGDVVIDSDDIRTICQTHRVVIDRKIFEQTKTQLETKVLALDDFRLIGPALCSGKLKGGKTCNGKLGSLMIFSNVPFVVLGLTRFGFEIHNQASQQTYKNWKFVPFIVDEIGPEDFQRYMPALSDVPEDDEDKDDNISEDPNKTIERILFDDQDAETDSGSMQSNTTLSGQSAVAIEGEKVLPSQNTDSIEGVGNNTSTENRNQLEQSGSGGTNSNINKRYFVADFPSQKTPNQTAGLLKQFSEMQVHDPIGSSHQTQSDELVELKVLHAAPSLSTHFSSMGTYPASEKLPSLAMSSESGSDGEDS